MGRLGSTIDLSQLPPPAVVEALDAESYVAAAIADYQARYPDFTAVLESEPVIKFIEVLAFRETLLRNRVNQAARAVMLAFAQGSDLDHAAPAIIDRLVITPATDAAPAVLEDDESFRRRKQLAPEAFAAAGPVAAYVFHALSASPDVKDVGVRAVETVVETDAGDAIDREVEIAVLSRQGDGAPSTDLIATVRARIFHRDAAARYDIKPLTTPVSVVAAEIVPYAVAGTLIVPPGPDPAIVLAAAEASIAAMAAAHHKVGVALYPDEVVAAAHVAGVRHAVLTGPAGIETIGGGPRQAPWLAGTDLTVEVVDD